MSSTEISDIEKCGWSLTVDGKEPGKELGSGHFAKVRLAQRKSDGLKAACKIIKKPKDLKKKALVGEEHKILTKVTHPYVVACYEAFETDERMYLFLELMTGGELFDRIVDQGFFTEDQAKDVTFKLLSALDYMHKQGVAHRDLKPENMLMTSKEKDAEVTSAARARRPALPPSAHAPRPPAHALPPPGAPPLTLLRLALLLRLSRSRSPTLASPSSSTSSRR